ncbi:MAG TPA: outer membrane beta-barrel protein [Pyrinomonadaceae bacterium]|jgi:hypothetical protein
MYKRTLVLAAGVLASLLACVQQASAQRHDAPKVEIGEHVTTLELHTPEFAFPSTSAEPGFGGRVGYNVTDYFGLEAELNFLPRRATFGRMTQGQFGVKVGKRSRKFGLFAKARPGFVSFREVFTVVGEDSFTASNGRIFVFPLFDVKRRTVFSLDVGGVVEFYPARNLLVRVDVGDTLIHYGSKEIRVGEFFSIRDLPPGTKHNLQVTTGVAYRFLNPKGADETEPPAPARASAPRFEAGIQYTTLVFNPASIDRGTPGFHLPLTAEAGIGGRFTFNLNDHLALEGAVDYLPGREDFDRQFSIGGHGVQGQFGVKAGRRFRRFGLFGKARPGFLSLGRVRQLVETQAITFGGQNFVFGLFRPGRKTYFETDLGGVVEFYPARRIVTRFDIGDTIIRYPERVVDGFAVGASLPSLPSETRHNFQFTAGVGFRF